jgi:hypothetical protein
MILETDTPGIWKVQLGGHRAGRRVSGWALVDEQDLPLVAPFKWSLIQGYATRGEGARGDQRMVRMHRQILGLQPGDRVEVDHVNRDKLDNRRANLRIADRFVNCQNVPPQRDGKLGLRGVRRASSGKRFQAYATVLGVFHHLGIFDTPDEAAAAAREFRLAAMPGAVD